ncbi:hypothetical protein ONE63_001080 [Megalurothrips usitatus]|uniref:Uncharacterized protein n=1 Tax=Megalurothrips usitatus TaxID=439358 RepID=A0AAV7XEP8_9NEOP|nr:hypothetical protein ONE63_001080 [Megalurothrips usitatus]
MCSGHAVKRLTSSICAYALASPTSLSTDNVLLITNVMCSSIFGGFTPEDFIMESALQRKPAIFYLCVLKTVLGHCSRSGEGAASELQHASSSFQ